MKIHKVGKQSATAYAGFGQYEEIPAHLCVGAKALYNDKSFQVTRQWKLVTCKHCLNKRVLNDKTTRLNTTSLLKA